MTLKHTQHSCCTHTHTHKHSVIQLQEEELFYERVSCLQQSLDSVTDKPVTTFRIISINNPAFLLVQRSDQSLLSKVKFLWSHVVTLSRNP